MAKVDSKGRIVLPQELRDALGITPGTEVEIHEEDGKAVVKPERDPDEIIERMEELIEGADANRQQTPYEELDPQSRDQVDTIRRQARQSEAETSDE